MLKYFSKHRQAWVDFKSEPTRGELLSLKKYHYKIMVNGVDITIDSLINKTDE